MLGFMAPKAKNTLSSAFSTKTENLLALAANLAVANTPADLIDIAYETKPAGNVKTAAVGARNYGFWGAGFGDFFTQEGHNSNPHITDTAAGLVIGFDYYGYQNGIFNITAGYTHNDITEGNDAGGGSSNGGSLSLYGTGYLGDGYLEGGVLGGYNKFDMSRHIVIGGSMPFDGTATSSFNDWVLMPHLGGGYDLMFSWGALEPFVSLDWVVNFQEAYQEKGAFPLNNEIESKNPSVLRSQIGLNVYETWDNATSALLFQQSVSYINKAFFNTNMVSQIVVPSTVTPGSFTVLTYNKTLNLAGVSAELFYKHKRSGFFASGAYSGEFGTSYISNSITGTLGVFF